MSLDLLPRTLLCALSCWALLYAPGQALLRTGATSLPTVFARILVSVITTTITATGLAAAAAFTLPAILAANAVVAGSCLFLRGWIASPAGGEVLGTTAKRELLGPLIFAVALAVYWPAYPAFLGASDSTAYVASGISLAHHGTLARTDELGPTLPRATRELLFDSMSQVFWKPGPPYRRMPGAMFIESLDATTAWPCFFPVPSVWAGIFVLAGAPGGVSAEAPAESSAQASGVTSAPALAQAPAKSPGGSTADEAAPGFAPLFAALALWSFYLLARCWLGTGWSLAAVVLLGASAPFYTSAKLPLSEPIAAYFVLAGLAAISSASSAAARATAGMRRADAIVAGAALGAAVFTRMEIGLLLAMAFALVPALRVSGGLPGWLASGLPAEFFVALLVTASFTAAQAVLLPGTYISPLTDHLQNVWIHYLLHAGYPTLGLIAGVAVVAALIVYAGCRAIGVFAMLRWGFLLGVLVGHWGASSYLAERTPMWLSFYLGWPGLGLAAVGAVLAWQQRDRIPAAPLLLALAAATVCILFYNPHVYPSLPWGARRFVPLLLPMLVLLGCYGCLRAAARNRLLGAVCAGTLVYFIAAGGRPVWGENLMEGAWSQLETISAAIPDDGTILIDREVSPMMLGPALWLILDRNAVTVPPTGSKTGHEYLPGIVWQLADKGPVYFVTRGAGNQVRTPNLEMQLLARETASIRLLEQTYDRRPERIERYVMPISVYRMKRSSDARGLVVNKSLPSRSRSLPRSL